jgi:hypothetical protein
MANFTRESLAQVKSSNVRRMRGARTLFVGSSIVATTALIAIAGAVLYAQVDEEDKYSLRSPDGIAFSDFQGYEDWAVASSARTDEVQKVIVANPAMIRGFKDGIPGGGQPFPEGSKIVKLQWSQKRVRKPPSPWMSPMYSSKIS